MESKKEKEKIVFFDEFAVDDGLSIFYGWAEKNNSKSGIQRAS